MKNPYKVLGVAQDAPDYVIQAAYRACLKRFHPDHYRGSDATARTSEVVAAYELLRDPVKRKIFDDAQSATTRAGKSSTPPPPPPPPREDQSGPVRPAPQPDWNQPAGKQSWIIGGVLAVGALVLYLANNSPVANSYPSSEADTVEMPADEAMVDTSATDLQSGLNGAVFPTPSDSETSAEDQSVPQSLSFQATPLEFSNVEDAADNFYTILRRSGISGARQHSERCHRNQRQSPSWDGLDYCAAFDFAAAFMDRSFTSYSGTPANAYFAFQEDNQADYYSGRYVASRLQSIRKASQAALSDKVAIEQLRASRSAKPGPTPKPSATPSGSADGLNDGANEGI